MHDASIASETRKRAIAGKLQYEPTRQLEWTCLPTCRYDLVTLAVCNSNVIMWHSKKQRCFLVHLNGIGIGIGTGGRLFLNNILLSGVGNRAIKVRYRLTSIALPLRSGACAIQPSTLCSSLQSGSAGPLTKPGRPV